MPTPDPSPRRPPGGIVHTYQKYDPKSFPSPTAEPPDLASAAMDRLLQFGSTRELTPEELASAIRLDPSMFPRLGPSLESIAAKLLERKRRILETYETQRVQKLAKKALDAAARDARPPEPLRGAFAAAIKNEQIHELDRLYHRVRDGSDFALDLVRAIERMGEKYQIEELASKYEFTGDQPLSVPEALEVKAELEAIDRLLEQLREAARNAQLAIIDMSELGEFADQPDIDNLNALRQQIEDYLREQAEAQGLEFTKDGYRVSPKAFRLFQRTLLREIFASLDAARTGRHDPVDAPDGVIETTKTRPYEFGDSAASLDLPQSYVNAALRSGAHAGRLRLSTRDMEVHHTRKSPKCATSVVIDMSGSMRHDGQYINAKRMALALDALIRTEYPGDFLSFVEVYSIAKLRQVAEIPALMPKPVTLRQPVVRLRADMADPKFSESALPPHFTNLEHGMRLARQVLSVQDTPNRQIMLITDGLPTAHFEGSQLFLLYPPDPRTEEATMREARLCVRAGITINVFLLPNWWQTSEDVQFAHKLAEQSRGRVFFTGGKDLDRFVLWDYVRMRRSIIA